MRDAGNFIAKLSKRKNDAPEWRAAMQALMLVAEHGGDTMPPRQASAAAYIKSGTKQELARILPGGNAKERLR